MDNTLISVIIPVYNLENYLSKCLDSVLAQSYSNFEILAVDDGSTDGSAQLLQEYAQRDSRVKPILKENGGVSSARNVGLDSASGAYIYFLDGDDWIEPNTFEKLLRFSDDFDIVQAAYIESYFNGMNTIPKNENFRDKEICCTEEMIASYFLAQIQESSCNKLYKKTVISSVRFDEDVAVAEDSEFVYNVLKHARKIKLLKDITYHYYIRENSCMHAVITEKHFAVMALRDKQYREVVHNKRLFQAFVYRYAKDIFFLIYGILHDENNKFKNRIPALRKKVLIEKKYIFKSRELKLKFKIGVLLLWLCPELFYKMYSR